MRVTSSASLPRASDSPRNRDAGYRPAAPRSVDGRAGAPRYGPAPADARANRLRAVRRRSCSTQGGMLGRELTVDGPLELGKSIERTRTAHRRKHMRVTSTRGSARMSSSANSGSLTLPACPFSRRSVGMSTLRCCRGRPIAGARPCAGAGRSAAAAASPPCRTSRIRRRPSTAA